ncbi:hypothetical protein AVEN_208814-1, partial [Araneus ventricosus]
FTPLKYLTVPCAQKRLAPYVRVSQSEHEFPFFHLLMCGPVSRPGHLRSYLRVQLCLKKWVTPYAGESLRELTF